jgi:hypothetical protein
MHIKYLCFIGILYITLKKKEKMMRKLSVLFLLTAIWLLPAALSAGGGSQQQMDSTEPTHGEGRVPSLRRVQTRRVRFSPHLHHVDFLHLLEQGLRAPYQEGMIRGPSCVVMPCIWRNANVSKEHIAHILKE